VALAAALTVIAVGAGAGLGMMAALVSTRLEGAFRASTEPLAALRGGLHVMVQVSLPVLGAAALGGLAAGLLQSGGRASLALAVPRGGRLLPWRGRGAAPTGVGHALLRSLVVTGVVLFVTASFLRGRERLIVGVAQGELAASLRVAGHLALGLLARLAAALSLLGALDLAWRRAALRRALRMTRWEALRERREDEGDPQHRAERRRLHREIVRRAALGAPLVADLVLGGLDQSAVALRYDAPSMAAPRVVASGAGLLGARLLGLARERGVPIVFDAQAVRALAWLEPDEEIPAALYDAVARAWRRRQAR
jgi:flagellar biosynthesis protein FlhB